MVRIQKQLVVEQDVEFGYGKVIQKRTVDGTVVEREYDKIHAGHIPAKNPIDADSDVQTELNSKLDMGAGDLVYAKINGNETELFKVANPSADNEAVPLSRLTSDLGSHTGNTSNPHQVTSDQVGLGNVDNTSDADKPVSDATQLALDDKAPLSHTTDLANPHAVTAVQVGADPDGSADAVQANLDTHIADTDTHGLITVGDGTNYLSDDGTYKNISPLTVHNQLTGRDGNDTHPIESITGLRTEIDDKMDGDATFVTSDFIVVSNGVEHAGKPIILDGAGQIDASLMGQGLYFVAMYTPDAANEYPDDTGESTGAFWGVTGVDSVNGYTFTGGDLTGETVFNGDMVVRGEQAWGYRNFGNVAGLYLRLDGSNSMSGNLPMGTNKIVNMSPATANGEAVEYSQIAGLTTAFMRLDGSTPMAGNLDIGSGANKIVNSVELAVNPTDVPNYSQLTAHRDNVLNPHQVTAVQVGAEPADPLLQAHLSATDNPHSVTALQIDAEPADPAIQTHLDNVANPHVVTAAQAGAEPSIPLGTAGQIWATNLAGDGKEWIDAGGGTGDMTKAIYDTDDSGVVDNAENLGGEAPAYYAPQSGLTSHTGATDNPHVVTAAQAGALPIVGGTITGNLEVDGQHNVTGNSVLSKYIHLNDFDGVVEDKVSVFARDKTWNFGGLVSAAPPVAPENVATKGYVDDLFLTFGDMYRTTSPVDAISIGSDSMMNVQNASYNSTAVGQLACRALTTGRKNSGFGRNACASITTGEYNTGLGCGLEGVTPWGFTNDYENSLGGGQSHQVGIGYKALKHGESYATVAIGSYAANYLKLSSDKGVYMGYNAGAYLDKDLGNHGHPQVALYESSGTWAMSGGVVTLTFPSGIGSLAVGDWLNLDSVGDSGGTFPGLESGDYDVYIESVSGNTATTTGTSDFYASGTFITNWYEDMSASPATPSTENTAIGFGAMSRNLDLDDYWDGSQAMHFVGGTALGSSAYIDGNDQCQLGSLSADVYSFGGVTDRNTSKKVMADIKPTRFGLGFINRLAPIDYKSKYGTRYHSVLAAEDVEQVLLDINDDFGGFQDTSITAGGSGNKYLNMQEFIAPMIKAIQELSAKVASLEN